jgi:hypothetical protein
MRTVLPGIRSPSLNVKWTGVPEPTPFLFAGVESQE